MWAYFQLSGVCLRVKNLKILFLHPLAEVFCEHLQFSDQKSIEIQENLSQICKSVKIKQNKKFKNSEF